jgi:sulfite reductase (NADPH) flavoprotein alpha-component
VGEFDTLLLIPAGIAVLLFGLLFVVLARRTRNRDFEPLDVSSAAAPIAPSPTVPPSMPMPRLPAVDRPPFEPWRLVERLLANPDSAGGPLYRLCFAGEYGVMPRWQPGAIAHIYCGPARDCESGSAPTGEYMIGSVPEDGLLDIVVRLTRSAVPSEGRRSRFLCEEIKPGDVVAIALSDEPGFMPPASDVPMIMIGNATGIAGLHAHIRARPPGTRNWLIYGDSNSSGDRALAAEITGWVATGHLARCDLVLPGDGPEKRLVVDQIEDARAPLLDWVLAGSAIYVCGSIAMGNDVDAALARLLGAETLEAMTDAGLYRRSVY